MATIEQAKELVRLTKIDNEFLEFYKNSFLTSLTQLTTGFPEHLSEELDSIKSKVKEIYDEHEHVIASMTQTAFVSSYSEAEAEGIIKFLSSPIGSVFLSKQAGAIIEVDKMLFDYEKTILYPEIRDKTHKLIEDIILKKLDDIEEEEEEETTPENSGE